jgi:lipoprotein-anchoring transpeptidase ErfK/SrfK
VRRITRQTPPEGTGPTEKWIDVDLDEQILAAYEGPRPVYVALISSGRASDDREHNFETPAGSFRISSKHVSNTMDGETPNGVYSIEDVPWVMYFQASYALHGAFWHHHFGWRMSHGCVNLSPPDARYIAYWSDPPFPVGWHGVYATPDRPGSRVVIRHSRANQHFDDDRPASVVANPTGN